MQHFLSETDNVCEKKLTNHITFSRPDDADSVEMAAIRCRYGRFIKIAIHDKSPVGKWTRKSLPYREANIFNLCVTSRPETCVNLVLNIFTLLAVTQSVDNVFH